MSGTSRWRDSGHLERAIATAGGQEAFDAAVAANSALGRRGWARGSPAGGGDADRLVSRPPMVPVARTSGRAPQLALACPLDVPPVPPDAPLPCQHGGCGTDPEALPAPVPGTRVRVARQHRRWQQALPPGKGTVR